MERTAQETDEIIKDIKLKVNLLTSIDKRFLIKYIKQTIRDEPFETKSQNLLSKPTVLIEPKETIEKNEELHRNNLVKFNF
jgi:hypothetical protein